ncbi:hypothetical protein EVAR_95517_1 [Eumeta japonica]|uniref:Uncharacterized protein n=1 Tax=Eumeta variegata TaxID=151549 RepID=A0A4C1UK50_EUMVA|nr:hypothetical protein EVAR_95517_1 [Eumeta japonica]
MKNVSPSHQTYWRLTKTLKSDATMLTLLRNDLPHVFNDNKNAEYLANCLQNQCTDTVFNQPTSAIYTSSNFLVGKIEPMLSLQQVELRTTAPIGQTLKRQLNNQMWSTERGRNPRCSAITSLCFLSGETSQHSSDCDETLVCGCAHVKKTMLLIETGIIISDETRAQSKTGLGLKPRLCFNVNL